MNASKSKLRRNPSFDELTNYLTAGQEKIKYPDREAIFLRNSPYLGIYDNIASFDLQEQDRQIEMERLKENKLHQIARKTQTTRSLLQGTRPPPDIDSDYSDEAVYIPSSGEAYKGQSYRVPNRRGQSSVGIGPTRDFSQYIDDEESEVEQEEEENKAKMSSITGTMLNGTKNLAVGLAKSAWRNGPTAGQVLDATGTAAGLAVRGVGGTIFTAGQVLDFLKNIALSSRQSGGSQTAEPDYDPNASSSSSSRRNSRLIRDAYDGVDDEELARRVIRSDEFEHVADEQGVSTAELAEGVYQASRPTLLRMLSTLRR